jgi:hypothetical protein
MLRRYYRWQLKSAIKRLPSSEDSLAATLIEIIEDLIE